MSIPPVRVFDLEGGVKVHKEYKLAFFTSSLPLCCFNSPCNWEGEKNRIETSIGIKFFTVFFTLIVFGLTFSDSFIAQVSPAWILCILSSMMTTQIFSYVDRIQEFNEHFNQETIKYGITKDPKLNLESKSTKRLIEFHEWGLGFKFNILCCVMVQGLVLLQMIIYPSGLIVLGLSNSIIISVAQAYNLYMFEEYRDEDHKEFYMKYLDKEVMFIQLLLGPSSCLMSYMVGVFAINEIP